MDKQGQEAEKIASTQPPVKVKTFELPSTVLGMKSTVIILLAVVLVGVATGFVASFAMSKAGPIRVGTSGQNGLQSVAKGTIIGSDDEKAYPDSVEGKLIEGGFEGEGAYHLERPGGESQNVYLTSSVLDLSKFIGKKVKVWGQTNTPQKVGWLMEVGRLQLLE